WSSPSCVISTSSRPRRARPWAPGRSEPASESGRCWAPCGCCGGPGAREKWLAGGTAEPDAASGRSSGELLRQRVAKLPASADAELAEDLAQVVLDRARADEQLGADLRVGVSVAGQPRDLELLGREVVARVRGDPPHGLAGGEELAAGTLGERS